MKVILKSGIIIALFVCLVLLVGCSNKVIGTVSGAENDYIVIDNVIYKSNQLSNSELSLTTAMIYEPFECSVEYYDAIAVYCLSEIELYKQTKNKSHLKNSIEYRKKIHNNSYPMFNDHLNCLDQELARFKKT